MIDPHRQRASELFGVPYSAVTPQQRALGKFRNYVEAYSARDLPPGREPAPVANSEERADGT